MCIIIEKFMSAAKKYTTIDYGFFKLLMATFGVLIGVYFYHYLLDFIGLVWVLLIISAIWMIYKMFKYTR